MNFEVGGASKGLIVNLHLHEHCWSYIMDHGKTRRKIYGAAAAAAATPVEYHRSLSQGIGKGSSRRLLPARASYFSLESLLLLLCLTASLLILPLILPPLPPPPFMLLLLPIGILAVLMILAFMPSNVRDITYTYV